MGPLLEPYPHPRRFGALRLDVEESRTDVEVAKATANFTSFCAQSGWKQIWAEEFSGKSLNTSTWTVDLGGNDSRVRDSQGTADNVYLEDGALVLRSQRQAVGGYQFTSGAVQSKGKVSFQGHTRVCVSAMLPGGGPGADGAGIWPAHWMMPDNSKCWPDNGEIDIMEMINGDGVLHGTYHWGASCGQNQASGGNTKVAGDWATAYHEYAVEYSKEGIKFALDGNVYFNVSSGATLYDVPYYVILNTAVGGPWPSPPSGKTSLPTYHRIDYVRASQQP